MELEMNTTPGNQSEEIYEPPYQIESGAYGFAKQELELLCKTHPTKDNPPIVKYFIPEILALVNKFGHSGQSGGSAPYTANTIAETVKKLCLFKSLLPITGDDSEWGEPFGEDTPRQNKRGSAVFKQDDGRCYYLDAISWKTQNNTSWHSNGIEMSDGKRIGSRQYIKSFPFEPKTFIIDVIETEVAKDNWEFSIKDEAQLKEVFDYYDPYFTPDKLTGDEKI